MSKKTKIIAVAIIAVISFSVIAVYYVQFRHPYTLPLGENPTIGLPIYDFSYNNIIQGFGNIPVRPGNTTFYHNGIDFGVNATTTFVCPHNAYVDGIKTWYNDKGGHWQTNVELWLNPQWTIEMTFESWALNETYANLQRNAILATQGQYFTTNQTIGNLLVHGSGAHVHFGVLSNGNAICPYDVLTPSAKVTFAAQFFKVNSTPSWNMP